MSMCIPAHPGAILAETLGHLNISARQFAERINTAPATVTRILQEEGPITPEVALRISAVLPGPSPEVWVRMQANYDTWQARQTFDASKYVPFTISTNEHCIESPAYR